MTQTIAFATAEAPELNRWLAEQTCQCGANSEPPPRGKNCWGAHGPGGDHRDCNPCQGTGLAFPRVSKECSHCYVEGHPWLNDEVGVPVPCHICSGSGRVPKAVGLEELLPILCEKGGIYITPTDGGGWAISPIPVSTWIHGSTPLLAALRAVCASLQPLTLPQHYVSLRAS